MSNTIADWKGYAKPGARDRHTSATENPDYYTAWIDSVSQPNYTRDFVSGSASRILDFNHPFWYAFQRQRRTNRRFRTVDVGGSLALERSSLSYPGRISGAYLWDTNKGLYSHFDGVYAPSVSYRNDMQKLRRGENLPIDASIGISNGSLITLGATAIAKSIPDVPDFSLVRFIGELREGLPKVPGKAILKDRRKIAAAGGEYLNVQFGLLPTISDISKLVSLAGNPKSRERIKHSLGQESRVRKTILKEKSVTTRSLTLNEMTTLPDAFAKNRYGTETVTDSIRAWSSTSFVWYQANRLVSLLEDLDEQVGNYGSIPKMIDIWNLTSWSWFIDWFANFNHVMTNLSYLGRDGLTIQRAYLMYHHERKVETFQSCLFRGSPAYSRGTRTYERKYRVHASPFGFGFKWNDFSPFQTSIIASLGVSRLKF